jgi:cell division protein FtsB
MFFEVSGDNKSLVELSAENYKLKEEAKEINSKLNIANERIKSLNRAKQCDDMVRHKEMFFTI